MLRQLFCTALLGSCALTANAEAWDFSYVGFVDYATGQFRPDIRIGGSFTGRDINGDGTISLPELTSLVLDASEYIGCGGSPYFRCHVDSFSYRPGGLVNYQSSYNGNDEYSAYWSGWTTTGVGFGTLSVNNQGQEFSTHYVWSDRTAFSISPVPEPLSATLLGIGLIGMAGARLRRR